MHKKLENDLMSLAHSVLQMKNKEDVFALKKIAQDIFEKLSLLAFVEEYVNTTPNLDKTKEELLFEVEKALEIKNTIIEDKVEPEPIIPQLEDEYLEVENEKLNSEIGEIYPDTSTLEEVEKSFEQFNEYLEVAKEEHIEQPFEELEGLIFGDTKPQNFKDDPKDVGERNMPTLEEELQDTIPVDVMANLFEPVKQTSLNDKLSGNIQIGLNDRIAFVKHLFNGSQEDFNRVVSQLNTLKTEKEAKTFINKMVKPDYNWEDKEELENRFMEIIERKFA